MKNKLFQIIFLLFSILLTAQENKFSIEINYPLALRNGEFDKSNGVVGGALKYRFKKTTNFDLGIDYTFDFLNQKDNFSGTDLNRNFYFHHLNFFSELNGETFKKFHPTFGAGLTMYSYNYDHIYENDSYIEIINSKENNLGINFKLGLNYNITENLYAHTYFHYIRTFKEGIASENKTFGFNHNQLKLGLGYKF